MKKIIIVSATTLEIQPFIDFLKHNATQKFNPLFGQNGYEIDILITGVGIPNTALEVGKALLKKSYNWAINAGVAGSFNKDILRGDIVEVVSEQYGDLGVEEADGSFTDVFELGLIEKNKKPFYQNKLINSKPLHMPQLRKVKGLTVNTVTGTTTSIESIKKKYQADIESMEGAAFFQACLQSIESTEQGNLLFAEIRAISNYVEPRNRDNWKMKEAITNLNTILINLFEKRII